MTLREFAAVEITFDRGIPTAINGVSMKLPDLIDSLTTIGRASDVAFGRGVLDAAREQLRKFDPVPEHVSGLVRLEFAKDAWRVVGAEQLDSQEVVA